MKRLTVLLAALMLLGCVGCAPNTQSGAASDSLPETTAPSVSETTEELLTLAPDFTVYDAEGNPVKLTDFRGKPVVLNFWASWCGPCKAEMPDFDAAFQTYGNSIHFVMINLTDGQNETVQSASTFIAENGFLFPVYYDTASEAASIYGISAIPCTFFIDARGYAVAMGSGMLNADALARGINMILPE